MKTNSENRIDLTIVVPVYNVKDTLYRAVESLSLIHISEPTRPY